MSDEPKPETVTQKLRRFEPDPEDGREQIRTERPNEASNDKLWETVTRLAGEVNTLRERVTDISDVAEEALEKATEAIAKVDTVAHAQVRTQEDFTSAITMQTDALKALGNTVQGARSIGIWVVGLLLFVALMSLVSIAMLAFVLLHR